MIKNILPKNVSPSPAQELNCSFGRQENTKYSKLSSIKGRVICLLLVPVHAAGIIVKSIVYVCYSVGAVFQQTSKGSRVRRTAGFAANVIVSPVGQVVQTAKAAAGIFHPGAYFKGKGIVDPLDSASRSRSDKKNGDVDMDDSEESPETAGYIEFEADNDTGTSTADIAARNSIDGESSDVDMDEFAEPLETAEEREARTTPYLQQLLERTGYYSPVLRLDVDYDRPVNDPFNMLQEFVEGIARTGATKLNIRFKNQRFYNAHLGAYELIAGAGLGRDFATRLFETISKRLELQKSSHDWQSRYDLVYKHIGMALQFQLSSALIQGRDPSQNFGNFMHLNYYKGLLQFTFSETRRPFTALSNDRLLDILIKITPAPLELDNLRLARTFMDSPANVVFSDEENQGYLELLNKALREDLVEDLPINAIQNGVINSAYLPELKDIVRRMINASLEKESLIKARAFLQWNGSQPNSAIGREHQDFLQYAMDCELIEGVPLKNGDVDFSRLPQLKALVADAFIRKEWIHTLHAIANGMTTHKEGDEDYQKTHLENLQHQSPTYIQTYVEGEFSKESFLQRMQFSYDNFATEPEIEEYLRDWAANKSDEELKRFLKYTTGSSTLSSSGIIFHIGPHNDVIAHACLHTIDIPKAPNRSVLWNKEMCLAALDSFCAEGRAGFNRH